ncbi:oleate hydratase [Talaromyces proteolyticus]|uniref:Oleate hydratase n=1 Tax=Talaromyces proteolyticus TaxID=1131652 RepID=A0AAD4PUB8_9EURO|nr:oleate hydratase [Talaromyces proteolyticus]KAH8689150.1 oleate hydratase [Talaromyces proteolyticus]
MTDSIDKNQSDIWLVGGGIASLAAAVFLINDSDVSANIHIFDIHPSPGGGLISYGDDSTGYVVHGGQRLSYHDSCVEKLLSQVPGIEVGALPWKKRRKHQTPEEKSRAANLIRAVIPGGSGLETLDSQDLGLTLHHRLELIRVVVESDHELGNKTIADVFSEEFFQTNFWMIWSTTFAFQPQHSAVELRRHLHRYLHDIINRDLLSGPIDMHYSVYESIVEPITQYLKSQNVDFRLGDRVIDLLAYPDSDPTTFSEIKYLDTDGSEKIIILDPTDLVFVTLGAMGGGSALGSNTVSPTLPRSPDVNNEWSLWFKLAEKSAKFGDPSNFFPAKSDSLLETFTVTLKDDTFFDRIVELTQNDPGTQPILSLPSSNWFFNISIPRQPVFHNQPNTVNVFWGWALYPEALGDFVKKPMLSCTGSEVMEELLGHLDFPKTVLANSITIPCINAYAMSPLRVRHYNDRPLVIPAYSTNMAFLGQFVEMEDEPTGNIEYSVRSAQLAVDHFTRGNNCPPSRKSYLTEILDVLK